MRKKHGLEKATENTTDQSSRGNRWGKQMIDQKIRKMIHDLKGFEDLEPLPIFLSRKDLRKEEGNPIEMVFLISGFV